MGTKPKKAQTLETKTYKHIFSICKFLGGSHELLSLGWPGHKTIQEAAQKGLPVCRHLFVHYPEDEYVLTLSHQQFLVGSEILVVPVLDKGKNNVKAYFPLGESSSWQHIWTGELYTKPGCEVKVDAPVGYPAVFIKVGSIVGETFVRNLKNYNIL